MREKEKYYWRTISLLRIFIILYFVFISSVSLSSDNSKLIKDIKNYFSNLKTLEADFIQIGPQGNVSKGKIYLDLPGKIRIEYKKPNNLLITSQGFWLYVQDKKSKQTTNIPISETPLNFLLKKNIDFDNKHLDVQINNKEGLITLSISEINKNENAKLILQFSENPISLKKWIIHDEFDNQTSVLLQNLNLGREIPYLLFFHDEFDLDKQ